MTFIDPTIDPENDPEPLEPESNDIRSLRRKAEKADALARENALLKAGINTESPLGAMFRDAYQGELTTDAIKAAWATVAPPAPPEPEPTTDPDPGPDPQAQQFADDRQRLTTGGAGDLGTEPERDPKKVAIEEGEKALQEGKSREDAMALAFSTLAQAAANGDQRVIVN